MGDQVEIASFAKEQLTFYKITSSAIQFEVKAVGYAVVYLAKRPIKKPDIQIVIGANNNTKCNIKNLKTGDDVEKSTPQVLSVAEYRTFSILWNCDTVKLYRNDEVLLSLNFKTADLKYVSFSNFSSHLTVNLRQPVNWRFQLPPMRPKKKSSPIIEEGIPKWVATGSLVHLPDQAIIGGYEDQLLYIIRASHRGSLTPGKFVPSEEVGYIAWGGQAHEKTDMEVLCGYNYSWVPTVKNRIPTGAIVGGYVEATHEPLYVGRAQYNGHLIPGKIAESHKCCYVAFGDSELAIKKYDILVNPNVNKYGIDFMLNHLSDSGSDSEQENMESEESNNV